MDGVARDSGAGGRGSGAGCSGGAAVGPFDLDATVRTEPDRSVDVDRRGVGVDPRRAARGLHPRASCVSCRSINCAALRVGIELCSLCSVLGWTPKADTTSNKVQSTKYKGQRSNMDTLLRDLRYGIRGLLKRPGFTI